jgi:hypothetical protein
VCSRKQAHRGGEKGGGAGDAYNRGQSTYRNLEAPQPKQPQPLWAQPPDGAGGGATGAGPGGGAGAPPGRRWYGSSVTSTSRPFRKENLVFPSPWVWDSGNDADEAGAGAAAAADWWKRSPPGRARHKARTWRHAFIIVYPKKIRKNPRAVLPLNE